MEFSKNSIGSFTSQVKGDGPAEPASGSIEETAAASRVAASRLALGSASTQVRAVAGERESCHLVDRDTGNGAWIRSSQEASQIPIASAEATHSLHRTFTVGAYTDASLKRESTDLSVSARKQGGDT